KDVKSNVLLDKQNRLWFLTSPPNPLSNWRGGVGTSQEPITKDKLHLVILPLQNLETKLNSEASKVPPLQVERGLGGEVNIALSEDEKLLAVLVQKIIMLCESMKQSSFNKLRVSLTKDLFAK
ncbi:MAG: hypothetical protein ACOVQA_03070, partial [Thermoflexibacteraceae bacterium]